MTRHSKKLKRGDRGSSEDDTNIVKKANMAAETGAREDGNEELVEKDMETEPSLTDLKGILHDIQQSISSILKDNKSLKEDLAHLKSSFSSKAQELKKLKESLETYKNENAALQNERETTKKSLAKQIDKLGNVHDQLDELEQYSRRNSIEIHGIPENAYNSTEEAVIKVAQALNVPLEARDIEITHKLRCKGNSPIIIKFLSHKTKTALYKAGTKLKDVSKISDVFPSYCSVVQSPEERIYMKR